MSDEEGELSDEEEQKGPKWPTSVSEAEGKLHFRLGNYQKAIKCFSSVLERDPKNVKILNARSQCYYRLMDYDLATKDVEEAIKIDPRRVQSLCQKGEIEFTEGDFEFAYLTFQRGYVYRPNFAGFRFGVQKCKDAILKSIGPESGLKLTDEDANMVANRLRDARGKHCATRKDLKKIDGEYIVEDFCETDSKRILREMSEDKAFFTFLLSDERVRQSVDDEGKSIQQSCRKALDFLRGRQSFWQMERPKKPKEELRSSARAIKTRRENQRSLEDSACKLIESGHPEEAIKVCRKALKFTSSTEFEEMARIYELMGWAYLDSGDYDSAVHVHLKQKMIAAKSLSPDALCRALRNLGEDYARKEDFQNELIVQQEILSKSSEDSDAGYTLGEICKCHFELGDFEKAREAGKRALSIAEETSNAELALDIRFIMGKVEAARGKFNRAILHMNRACQLASIAGDEDFEKEAQQMVETLKQQLEDSRQSDGYVSEEEDTDDDDDDDDLQAYEKKQENTSVD